MKEQKRRKAGSKDAIMHAVWICSLKTLLSCTTARHEKNETKVKDADLCTSPALPEEREELLNRTANCSMTTCANVPYCTAVQEAVFFFLMVLWILVALHNYYNHLKKTFSEGSAPRARPSWLWHPYSWSTTSLRLGYTFWKSFH